jgi:hypothetical protein
VLKENEDAHEYLIVDQNFVSLYTDHDSSSFHNDIGTLHSMSLISNKILIMMESSKKAIVFNPKKACKTGKVTIKPISELVTGNEARIFLKLGKRILFVGAAEM